MNKPTEAGFRFAALILAAGSSTRMGRPKLLLPWGTTSILGHLLRAWNKLGASQVAVVCAENDPALRPEWERMGGRAADRITNANPQYGMFSSIQCAARWDGWQPGLTHWAIVLGDQPHLRPETLSTLMAFARRNPHKICQPAQDGRSGHPVLLPESLFRSLASTNARNLKEFLHDLDVAQCEVSDPGLHLDLDRPEDYAQAELLAGITTPESAQDASCGGAV
jgi:molybdenum cofactor cytidylyltransferase